MRGMTRARLLTWTGALGALAVLFGAFGAHWLRTRVPPESLDVFETGVRYHVYHTLAMGLCAALAPAGRVPRTAPWCFLGGIVLFSGSLYLLVLTGQRWLGAVTPVGGVLFVAGWIALALTARRDTTPQ